MYDDNYNPEKIGNKNQTSEYYDLWNNGTMDDAPAFAGEESSNESLDTAQDHPQSEASGEGVPAEASDVTIENPETAAENGQQLQHAGKLAGYGLDVACREYGIDTVVKAIEATDLTGRDVDQPIGSIYARIAPNADERRKLFDDISQDEEYAAKALQVDRSLREQSEAVASAKKLFDVLETNDRFADIREKASARGQDVVSYLVAGEAKPTLSFLFDKIGENFDAEELAEEIVAEAEESEEPEGSATQMTPDELARWQSVTGE